MGANNQILGVRLNVPRSFSVTTADRIENEEDDRSGELKLNETCLLQSGE